MIGLPTDRPPTHPGEMLNEEFLKPLGIKQKDAAEDLGISLVRLNEIIKGKRGVTPDTALRLARRFGMSGEFWLGLQADWDLYHTLHGREASAINKIRLHPELAAV
jgi:addiction module HigA family antidote